jgi:hypothetical protein
MVRLFFFSGIFKRMLLPRAARLLEPSKGAPLAADLGFFSGLGLNLHSTFSPYREKIYKSVISKGLGKGKKLWCWVDRLGDFNRKKRGRWLTYIFGYYRRKRRKASMAR